jgi:hypothetical protein
VTSVPQPITLTYANSTRTFSSISQLRDALLGSYPGAAYLGAPVVMINRDDAVAAWGWLRDLLRTRTDWWPAVGIALQHAAQDGGDNARIALADFLESLQESVVLLEWTEPLAKQWPDVKAGVVGTTFGRPDYRLATIVEAQRALWNQQQSAPVSVEGLGPKGSFFDQHVKTQADLEALLAKSAKAGQHRSVQGSSAEGPWTWLLSELLFHHDLQPMVPKACEHFTNGSHAEVCAMLDWFTDEHDLWRYVDLLESWIQTPPAWWKDSAAKKPPGWRNPIRGWHARNGKPLGDIVEGTLYAAQAQVASAPNADLAPIFGARPA